MFRGEEDERLFEVSKFRGRGRSMKVCLKLVSLGGMKDALTVYPKPC